MARLLIETKVRDYTSWRPAYDAHEPSRIEATVTNGRVYCRPEDRNDMLLLFDVANVDKARAWTVGDDLKGVMKAAGVPVRRRSHSSVRKTGNRRRIGPDAAYRFISVACQ